MMRKKSRGKKPCIVHSYHPVQKYHSQQYLWYFCTKITIKLLECIKKERILKVSRTKVPQLKIFVVFLYQN